MSIDPRSVIIIICTGTLLMSGGLFVVSRGYLGQVKGVSRWATATLIHAAGWIVVGVLRGILPDAISIIIGHTLLLASLAMYVLILSEFNKVTVRISIIYILIFIQFFFLVYNSVFNPDVQLRNVVLSVFTSIFMFKSVFVLLSNKQERFLSYFLTAFLFGVCGIAQGIRAIYFVLWNPNPSELAFSMSMINDFSFIVFFTFAVMINFGFVLMSNDRYISQLREVEEKLRVGEEKWRSLFALLPVGISLLDSRNSIREFNPALAKILGLNREGLLNGDYSRWEYLNSDGYSLAPEEFPSFRAIKENQEIHSEVGIKKEDGSIIWTKISAAPLSLHGYHSVVVTTDITESKKAQEALHESEKRFRHIIELSPIPYALNDENLNIVYLNAAFIKTFGYDLKDIPTVQHWWPLAYPNSKYRDWVTESWQNRLNNSLTQGTEFEAMEADVHCKNGSVKTVIIDSVPLSDSFKGLHLVILYNITERKLMEDTLRESEKNLNKAQFYAHLGNWTWNVKTNIVKWSDEMYRIFGIDKESFTGDLSEVLLSSIHPEDFEKVSQRLADIRNNASPIPMEYRVVWKDGTTRIVLTETGEKLLDPEGNLFLLSGIVQDITEIRNKEAERINLEQKLIQSKKLESLGVLAGGIAHDFNNLLSGIYGYTELAFEESKDGKISNYLQKILNTIDRTRALTNRLLTFSKGGAPVQKIGKLFPFINESIQFNLSGSNCSYSSEVASGLWSCNFDKNQIGQVIDNLIINARQAMPDGGTIFLTAENITLRDKEHQSLPKGKYVKVSITDSGVGMPNELIQKIFDPFFSTKSEGHGLGLTSSFSIITQHGGCIDVTSEPGKGSTFQFLLPAWTDFFLEDTGNPVGEQINKSTILLMDDEDVVRDSVGELLKSLGYDVICKDNGRDAIDFFLAETIEKRKFSAMIFDITIPGGMGGKEAVLEIRKLNSDVPIFVASGYAEDRVMANPEEYGFTGSIRKPFSKSELVALLNKFLP